MIQMINIGIGSLVRVCLQAEGACGRPIGARRDMKRSLRSSGEIARPVGLGETEQKRAKAPATQGPYSRGANKQKVGGCVASTST